MIYEHITSENFILPDVLNPERGDRDEIGWFFNSLNVSITVFEKNSQIWGFREKMKTKRKGLGKSNLKSGFLLK